MRNMVMENENAEVRKIPMRIGPLRTGRYYTQEHCWISIRSADTIRIGLDPNLAIRCIGLLGISLSAAGREIPARNPLVWIRFEKGMIPVRLPLPVRVVSGNTELPADPGLLVRDPYDKGWLLDAHIECEHLDECGFMTSWIAEKVYSRDEQYFAQTAREMLGLARKEIGATAFDGGNVSPNLMDELGNAQYCALLGSVYCKT